MFNRGRLFIIKKKIYQASKNESKELGGEPEAKAPKRFCTNSLQIELINEFGTERYEK